MSKEGVEKISVESLSLTKESKIVSHLVELDAAEMKAFQAILKTQANQIMGDPQRKVGSFKTVAPVTSDVAVALIASSKTICSQKMLQDECQLLRILSENQLPTISTYGEVFEIEEGRHAVLMDWIPNALLWDAKDPDTQRIILASHVLGISLPRGEAFAMHLERLSAEILQKFKHADNDMLSELKTKANALMQGFTLLLDTMNKTNIRIGDLQLLIDESGKIKIIDPIAVLQLGSKINARYSSMRDLLDSTKENQPAFVNSIIESEKMLANSVDFCTKLAQAKDIESVLQIVLSSVSIQDAAVESQRKMFIVSTKKTDSSESNREHHLVISDKRLARVKRLGW